MDSSHTPPQDLADAALALLDTKRLSAREVEEWRQMAVWAVLGWFIACGAVDREAGVSEVVTTLAGVLGGAPTT